jgi:hypothetical protein
MEPIGIALVLIHSRVDSVIVATFEMEMLLSRMKNYHPSLQVLCHEQRRAISFVKVITTSLPPVY